MDIFTKKYAELIAKLSKTTKKHLVKEQADDSVEQSEITGDIDEDGARIGFNWDDTTETWCKFYAAGGAAANPPGDSVAKVEFWLGGEEGREGRMIRLYPLKDGMELEADYIIADTADDDDDVFKEAAAAIDDFIKACGGDIMASKRIVRDYMESSSGNAEENRLFLSQNIAQGGLTAELLNSVKNDMLTMDKSLAENAKLA